VLIRRELLEAFNLVCNELKLTQQECFLTLLKLFAIVGSSFGGEKVEKVSNKLKESLKSEFSNKEVAGWLEGLDKEVFPSVKGLVEKHKEVLKENEVLKNAFKELDSILDEALDILFDYDEVSWVKLDDRRDEVKKRVEKML